MQSSFWEKIHRYLDIAWQMLRGLMLTSYSCLFSKICLDLHFSFRRYGQTGRILFYGLGRLATPGKGQPSIERKLLSVGQVSGGILALVGEMETVRGTKIRESNRQVSGDWLIQRRRKIIVSHKIGIDTVQM
jgi:hypothetical protein